ncbi:MAG: hypothetical protein ACR2LC_08810 [Pyrinomonadaceae bacterium]
MIYGAQGSEEHPSKQRKNGVLHSIETKPLSVILSVSAQTAQGTEAVTVTQNYFTTASINFAPEASPAPRSIKGDDQAMPPAQQVFNESAF